jgi:ABC-type transport system involved in cytochrome c biogenesis permease component
MLIPLLIASVKATTGILSASIMGDAAGWGKVLAVFDVIFLAATFVTFEYVIEA